MNRHRPYRSLRIGSSSLMVLVSISLFSILWSGCSSSSSTPHVTGPAGQYSDATARFSKGNFARALDLTDNLAKGNPPSDYTTRARVLRALIFSGQADAFRQIADAYSKGADNTKRPEVKSEYLSRRRDIQMLGAQITLHLAEVAHQLTHDGTLPSDLTLDAPYPAVEGPADVPQLAKVTEGVLVGPDDLESAVTDLQRKDVDDALGAALGGDRAAARNTMKSPPVKLDDYKFAVFLTKELLNGAAIFDRKHIHDPERLKILCDQASAATDAALAALKANPDKQKEKEIKNLQDQIKTTVKNG